MNNVIISNEELYRRCMVRVKHRVKTALEVAAQKKVIGGYMPTTEFLALQVRKTLEGIALAGICAHREKYKAIKKRLDKEWQLSQIVPRLDRVNPRWYPNPLENEDGPFDPATGSRPLRSKTGETLSKEQFIEMHGRMGQLLHEDNPVQGLEDRNWEMEFQAFPKRLSLITNLLNKHKVFPLPKVMWIVQMHVVPGDRVVVNTLIRTGPPINR